MNLLRNKKVLLFIAAFAFFVVSLGFLLTRSQKISPNNPPSPPQIPNYVNQTFPIKVQFSKDSFKFPSALPLLYKGPTIPFTIDEAIAIAQEFGFTGEPQNLKDVYEGTVYFWSGADAGLFVSQKSRGVKYSVNQTLSTSVRRLTENELIAKAALFLEDRKLITADLAKTAFVNYFQSTTRGTEGLTPTTIDKATVVQVNFSAKESDYKIVTFDPLSSPIRVRLLPDGNITEVDLIKLPQITKGEDLFRIKNYDQFISTLKEARIISLNDGEMLGTDPNANPINNVNVSEVELVYLLDSPTSNYYQPVFLIKGTADIEGIGKDISAYLYLAAIAK